MANLGTVVTLKGQASIVDEKGNKRPLHLGDLLQPGDIIITPSGSVVDLQLNNGRAMQVSAEQTVKLTQELADTMSPDTTDSSVGQSSIQAVIKAVGEGTDISDALDPPAAGLAASSPSYGFSFVNLLRIAESVTPLNYAYDSSRVTPIDFLAEQVITTPPINNVISITTNIIQTLSVSENNLTANTNGGIDGTNPDAALTIQSQDFSRAFTITGGGTTVYALSVTGLTGDTPIESHIIDTGSGQNVMLSVSGNIVTGYVTVAGDNLNVFTVGVDPTSGLVTLLEFRAIHQDSASNTPHDAPTLNDLMGASTAITLIANVSDGKGNNASASINLGAQLSIQDDGPSFIAQAIDLPILSVNESNLILDTNGGIDGSNPNTALTSQIQDFSGAFTVITGADGGTTNYALSVTGLTEDTPVESTIIDTGSGQNVMVSVSGNIVTGYVTVAGDNLNVFTVEVDSTSGNVTLSEFRAIHQDSLSNTPNDAPTLNDLLGTSTAIMLTSTLTDGDGDKTSASINLGAQLSIQDDGPSIIAQAIDLPILSVNESYLILDTNGGIDGSNPNTALTSQIQDFSGAFTVITGADGGTTNYALSVTGLTEDTPVESTIIDTGSGQNVMVSVSGNIVTGYVTVAGDNLNVFTVEVDSTSGNVTLSEFRAIHQDSLSNTPNDAPTLNDLLGTSTAIMLTSTLTDGDGDKTSASINLGAQLSIQDDGPSIIAQAIDLPILSVSESNLTASSNGGIGGSTPGIGPTTVSHDFSSAFFVTTGADSGTTNYALSITGQQPGNAPLDSGLIDITTGNNVMITMTENVVTGYVATVDGNLDVFTVGVDSTSGNVTLTEFRAISQNSLPPQDTVNLSNLVTLTATVTDGDSDQTSDHIDLGSQLSFVSDNPQVMAAMITSGTLHNVQIGTSGDDTLNSDNSNDTLIGGAGNDILNGGLGVDVFKWELADKGTIDAPATDTVNNFNLAPITNQGDALNLQDLLIGEHDGSTGVTSNLTSYLHFDQHPDTAGGINDTVISISSTGQFTSGYFDATKVDQTITLTHVDLIGSVPDQATMIQNLLTEQKLITDH